MMEEARLMEGIEASDSAKPEMAALGEARKLEIEGAESVPYRQAGRTTYAGGQCPTGGAWEAAVHFLTQVSTYPNLITPFILASIGWTPGIIAAILVFSIKVYCSYLMAGINVIDSIRYNRYRDLAEAVWGYPGYVSLVIIDILLVLGSMIGGILSGGILLKTLVLLYLPDTSVTLAEFILIVGGAVLLMSLIPTLHHLRWVNAFGVSLVLLYCVITGGLCIGAAVEDGAAKDYAVIWGSPASRVFQVLNAVMLLGSVPVSPMLPEAQATLREPVRDMRQGLALSWPLVMLEASIVAIPGYYAFGSAAGDPNRTYVLQLLTSHRGAVATALAMVVLNVCIMSNLFGQPLYELLEHFIADPRRSPMQKRIFITRALCRGAFVCLFVFIAALIPFFSSIQGLFSALTFVPMDVIIPLVLYQHVRQPGGLWKVFHYSLAVVFSLFCVGGAISSLRGIIVSASTFKVFANL